MLRRYFRILAISAILLVSACGEAENSANEGKVIRVHMDAWNAAGEQVSNREDGITTFVYDAIGASLPPVQAALADASPGDKISISIAASELSENNRTFAVEDHRVEISVIDIVAPVPAPAEVAAPPADARVLADGTAIKFTRGSGEGERPLVEDNIEVHYSGWTTDGVMFDSTHLREATASFPLNLLIGGWQSAVPEMGVGDIALIWIPGEQAYANREDRPFSPKGMLVFEVELVAVLEPVEEASE